MPQSVRIKPGITADQFGCDQEYFEKHIKSKKLTVIYETQSGYIRATDQNGEEWGLFSATYKVVKPKVVQKESKPPDAGGHSKPLYQWAIPEDR